MWNWACAGVTILVVSSILGAVPLRASVAFCNKFAGFASSREIPEPEVGEAMWILFVTILVNMVLGLLVLALTGPGAVLTVGRNENSAGATLQLFTLAAGFLVMAGLLTRMLPTTFAQAILVTMVWMIACVFLSSALVAMILAMAWLWISSGVEPNSMI